MTGNSACCHCQPPPLHPHAQSASTQALPTAPQVSCICILPKSLVGPNLRPVGVLLVTAYMWIIALERNAFMTITAASRLGCQTNCWFCMEPPVHVTSVGQLCSSQHVCCIGLCICTGCEAGPAGTLALSRYDPAAAAAGHLWHPSCPPHPCSPPAQCQGSSHR